MFEKDASAAPPSEQAALWYAVAVSHHVAADSPEVITAGDRGVALAAEGDSPGWAANLLALRAMGLARQGRMEPALLDMARAEVELDRCHDPRLRCWAHTGLGYCYLELRLYELAQPHRSPVTVSLVVVDLNEFKQINDTYGHVVGDEVLRAVATAIRGVVLARGADLPTGRRLARRVAEAIDQLSVGSRAGAITLRAAVGVATTGSGHDVGALLAEADAAMYDAKAASRS